MYITDTYVNTLRAIKTRGLYILYPIFEDRFLKVFSENSVLFYA